MARATLDAHQIQAIYDRLAPTYDRRRRLLEWALLRRYRRRLLARARGKVLEVGLGTGLNLPWYPPDCAITGTDLSNAMLRIAERRAQCLGRSITLQTMDTEPLGFPSESFDTVVSTLAFCTIIDPLQALGEMTRVLRREGQLLLLEHGRCSYRLIARWQDRLTPRQVGRIGCHPNRNIIALVQAADLKIVWQEGHWGGILRLIQAVPLRAVRRIASGKDA
jgi:ubiquinone/menaquinone biosynthesis C-methylase UbiE